MASRKPAAKKKAAKKAAPKRKPAAKQPPEPDIQVNRMTDAPPKETKPKDEISKLDERGMQTPKEGADPDRDTSSPGSRDQPSVTEKMTEPDVLQYEPTSMKLEHSGFDHYGAEEKRQAELAEEREEHNRRTGDASRR